MSTQPTFPDRRFRPRIKRLVAPLVGPPVFDFWAAKVNRSWSWERPLARIVDRHQESADVVTLTLRPNGHWRGFAAGQHVNVTAEIGGVRVTRSYSPSGAPGSGRMLQITVKAIEGGRLSRHLCRAARVGDILELGQAFGAMALPPSPLGPLLFLAAGSGITPLMSLVRQLAAQGMPAPLTLLYWARTRSELCFVEELRALAAVYPGFAVHFVLTREAAGAADEREGRLDAGMLREFSDLAQRHVFACGPGGFVAGAQALLATEAASFLAEAFTPPPSTVEEGGQVRVTLVRSGRTLDVPRRQSLLGAFEAQGLRPASGCRMGICNTCSCAKRSGQTRHLHTGELTAEPVTALKLCISGATTDLVLDL
ncbi:MAG TPA: ferredoxin reductase [Pseudoxanthomonas sp.]|nr:ferredoxin reductase [Pseudoxanthomonas sp.]